MADITIDSTTWTTAFYKRIRLGRCMVSTGGDTLYSIYLDATTAALVYRKSTDGGATWSGSATQINASNGAGGCGVWFDQWTPGDSGTKIHMVYIQANANSLKYRNLDTSSDTLSSEVTIGGLADGSEWLDIVKARDGKLYAGGKGALTTQEFALSTDGGASWDTTIANPIEGSAYDLIILMPGNETDQADIVCIYWDTDNLSNEISLKTYDHSADSWSAGTSIISGVDEGSTDYVQFAAMQRHSDNHIILIAWNDQDATTADLLCWDINGEASITAKTNVLTNSAESVVAGLCINQVNNDLYAFYFRGGTWLDTVTLYYKKSTDGGTTWGTETAFSADAADDLRYFATTRSISATLGGRVIAQWQNDDTGALKTNKDNSIAVAAPTAAASGVLVNRNPLSTLVGGGLVG